MKGGWWVDNRRVRVRLSDDETAHFTCLIGSGITLLIGSEITCILIETT